MDRPWTRTAHPATPPEFNGDRTKKKAFLNLCQTYIWLCLSEFLDKQTKIVWAMSYMKTSRAQRWTDQIFCWEQQPENLESNCFLDWEDFCEEFQRDFTPSHTDTQAVNNLETAAYFQKGRSLDDYINEFQDLITDSGYTDPKTIVVKFHRGLNAQIQNAVVPWRVEGHLMSAHHSGMLWPGLWTRIWPLMRHLCQHTVDPRPHLVQLVLL